MMIAIIIEHKFFLEGVSKLIYRDYKNSVKTFIDPVRFLKKYKANKYDLVIIDTDIKSFSFIELIGRIKLNHFDQKVLLISHYKDISLIYPVKSIGVNGIINKSSSINDINGVIRSILLDDQYFLPDDLISKPNNCENLSKSEIVVVQLLGYGFTSNEISKILKKSVFTVNTQRRNILKKLEISNSLKLIKWAIGRKLIK